MKFVENLKKAAEKTFSKVAIKTGEIVEDSKTKYSIFDLNNDIEKIYAELGKEIYRGYKADENVSEFIETKCAEIDKINAEVELLKQKLED